MNIRPRRSMLYMPGANQRALHKARSLPADSLILDLEDAVAVDAKQQAREQVVAAINEGGYGQRELLVRINDPLTEVGQEDLLAIAKLPIDGVVLPKVENAAVIQETVRRLEMMKANDQVGVWAMAETPLGVLNIRQVASADPRLVGIIMGTSDLAKEMRIPHTPDRLGFLHALSQCVLAARAYGLDIIDGVHLDLDDAEGYQRICQQGRKLGFDGKSLIHPKQVDAANTAFAPSADDLARADKIIAAWRDAEAAGQGVVLVDGKLVENLHVEEAQRCLTLQQAIESLAQR